MMGTREAPFRPERICILPSSHFGCKTPGIAPKRAPMNVLGVKTPFLHPKSALTPPRGPPPSPREPDSRFPSITHAKTDVFNPAVRGGLYFRGSG